jgi:hypothetical protein
MKRTKGQGREGKGGECRGGEDERGRGRGGREGKGGEGRRRKGKGKFLEKKNRNEGPRKEEGGVIRVFSKKIVKNLEENTPNFFQFSSPASSKKSLKGGGGGVRVFEKILGKKTKQK